jgi:hypothetical protein
LLPRATTLLKTEKHLPVRLKPYISIIEPIAYYLLRLVAVNKRVALTLITKMFIRLIKLGY